MSESMSEEVTATNTFAMVHLPASEEQPSYRDAAGKVHPATHWPGSWCDVTTAGYCITHSAYVTGETP